MRAAIAALPPGQRAAVGLLYLGGLRHAEVARVLGTRPGAVKTRLHKARAKLRRHLSDIREEPVAVPMHVADVRRTAGEPVRHIVFLAEEGGERRLPIGIGRPEATAKVWALEQVELPRPGPYQFAALPPRGRRRAPARGPRQPPGRVDVLRARRARGLAGDRRPAERRHHARARRRRADPRRARGSSTRASGNQAAMPELVAEALDAPDDARALADEERARIAEMAREIAELNERRAGA